MLSLRGADKLIKGQPLGRLVPVDEYLPIMFDRHAERRWAEAFPSRDLKAYSAGPLLVYPTQYTGEAGYISDTESSEIVAEGLRSRAESNAQGKGAKEVLESEIKVQLVAAVAAAAAADTVQVEDLNVEIRSEL